MLLNINKPKEDQLTFDFLKTTEKIKTKKSLLQQIFNKSFLALSLFVLYNEVSFIHSYSSNYTPFITANNSETYQEYGALIQSLNTKNTEEKINHIVRIKQLGEIKDKDFGGNSSVISTELIYGFYKQYLTNNIYEIPEKRDEKLIDYIMNDTEFYHNLAKGYQPDFKCTNLSLLCNISIKYMNSMNRVHTFLDKRYINYNFEISYIKEHPNEYKKYYEFEKQKNQELLQLFKNGGSDIQNIILAIRKEDPFLKYSHQTIP